MRLRLENLLESFRQSLFQLPLLMVVGSIVLSQAMLQLDQNIDDGPLPELLRTSVDSARAILTTIATALIAGASLVFSITLVAVQLAASQFSPRTLRSFLGDRFQQFVIGIVLGTAVYNLLVLRQVRAPLDEGGDPLLPHLSVVLAVALALASLIAIIASVNHVAQSLQVESQMRDIAGDTISLIRERFRAREVDLAVERPGPPQRESGPRPVPAHALAVESSRAGWVQQVDLERLADLAEQGHHIAVVAAIGTYHSENTPVAWIWKADDEPFTDDDAEAIRFDAAGTFDIGPNRTMQQDIEFGIVRLVDIALRALSPGINDPNTAVDVIDHLGSIILEIYRHDLPPPVTDHGSGTVQMLAARDHEGFIRSAVDQLRPVCAGDPRVARSLVSMLASVKAEVERTNLDGNTSALDRQIELVLERVRAGSLQEPDVAAAEAASDPLVSVEVDSSE